MSNILNRALSWWQNKIKKGEHIISSSDFPDEYIRKILLKRDLAFPLKSGISLLKKEEEAAEDIVYLFYWKIAERILRPYLPWSIEKESALGLHLGNYSVPETLKVRTGRFINHAIKMPFDLKIAIRPDIRFKEKTTEIKEFDQARICCDIPERLLFTIRNKETADFISFLKGTKFDPRTLEVLYAASPKPVTIKRLIVLADKNLRHDLSIILEKIRKEYTIYRVSKRRRKR